MLMGTYILELFDCDAVGTRNECVRELEKAGMYITNERIDFFHRSIRFFMKLNMSDKHTEETFLNAIRKTKVWERVGTFTKIERGSKKPIFLAK